MLPNCLLIGITLLLQVKSCFSAVPPVSHDCDIQNGQLVQGITTQYERLTNAVEGSPLVYNVRTKSECTQHCLLEHRLNSRCVSVNYNKETKECTLNEKALIDDPISIQLESDSNWQHIDMQLGPPATPSLRQVARTAGTITVEWATGFSGGYQQLITLEYKLTTDINYSVWATEIEDPGKGVKQNDTISGLLGGNQYDIRVTAINDRPRGINSSYTDITATTPSPLHCTDWKSIGATVSGDYLIDPDGEDNGVDPFIIYCDFSYDTPVSVIHHDREDRTNHQGYGSTTFLSVTYTGVSVAQVTALIDISGHCHQYLSSECSGAIVISGATKYSSWLDRSGSQSNHWAGGTDSSLCFCGKYGICDSGQTQCSCNNNDLVWRKDDGFLRDKTLLPVTQLGFGDIDDANEQLYRILGPVRCSTATNDYPATCTDWKALGYDVTTAAYEIDPDGSGPLDFFPIECDMTSTPTTGSIHHNTEARTAASKCGSNGCFVLTPTYYASMDQMTTYMGYSAGCRQNYKYECHHSLLTNYAYWKNRNSVSKYYWGGSDEATGGCACNVAGTCPTGKVCNCDLNDEVWREDDGYFTTQADLPVTWVGQGDTDAANEDGYLNLGPLICDE